MVFHQKSKSNQIQATISSLVVQPGSQIAQFVKMATSQLKYCMVFQKEKLLSKGAKSKTQNLLQASLETKYKTINPT